MKEKVVFLVRNVSKEKFGGGEMYQLLLANELKKKGFLPIILTNSYELIKKAKEEDVGVLVPPYIENQNWSGWKNILLPIYYFKQRKLKKWYKNAFSKYNPVAVNLQSRDDMIAGTIAARGRNIKVLWTDHADFKNWVLWNVNKRFKNTIGKRIIKLSEETSKVIFVGENIYKDTEKLIKPKTIKHADIIYNGVCDKKTDYSSAKQKNGSFVFVGRVVQEKGVGELLDAFDEVQKKYPDVSLSICGDGDKELIDKIKKTEGVVFCGKVDEPLKELAEDDIFVLPSYYEGVSLSLLDAIMMGKKIIATDIEGNKEVIENEINGRLVPIKNDKALAKAMIWMLEHKKEAEGMAKNARKCYKEKFDFEKIFEEKMLPLYNTKKEEE